MYIDTSVENSDKTVMQMYYNGWFGSVEIEGDVYYGKVVNTRDLIMYESDSMHGLFDEFIAAIEEYITDCGDLEVFPSKLPIENNF